MKRFFSLAICILTAVTICSGCAFGLPAGPRQTQEPGAAPQTIQHWVTKAISNDGLKLYDGDLEIYLRDDGSAYVVFRDYNVRDYSSDRDEYQTDENGELYNEYGLHYKWSEAFDTITFGQADLHDYYVTADNKIQSDSVKSVSDQFTMGKGKIQSDGTMRIAFAFSYVYEDGYRNPNKDYFILEQSADLAGAQYVKTQSEAEAELAAIVLAMEETDHFTKKLIAGLPGHIAQFYRYNNYEKVSGSFWFTLGRAGILYSGDVLFAVVNVALYPEYAHSGSGAVYPDGDEEPEAIEVLRNENTNFSLLYQTGQKPSDAVLSRFLELDSSSVDIPGEGTLQDFFYRFGSGFSSEPVTEYEIMSLSMTGSGEGGIALLYIREYDWLLDGYPIEVPAEKLRELSRIIDEHGIKDWEEEYEPEEMATDGYGYFLAAQYDDSYTSSSGYMAYPQGYQQAHDAIVAFFEDLRAKQSAAQVQQVQEEQLGSITGIDSITFSYGNYVNPDVTSEYQIYKTDGRLLLSYGNLDGWEVQDVPLPDSAEQEILDIYRKHDAFSWDGFEQKDENTSDYVFLNDLYTDADGRLVGFHVYGMGHEPEGFAAFRDELSAYLDSLLQAAGV